MKRRYFINGWRESKNYFLRVGHFTHDELDRLDNGETIKKGGNDYRIDTEEV